MLSDSKIKEAIGINNPIPISSKSVEKITNITIIDSLFSILNIENNFNVLLKNLKVKNFIFKTILKFY
tara:strand:- start:363 stop:566 length:204 start_codon:yes stop_codon:yes gene_type:complete